MGTSVEVIDQTYDHLAPDADEWELGRLDAFDSEKARRVGTSWAQATDHRTH
jgi:hypothetical protein